MPPPETRNTRRRETQRANLIAAAGRVFARQGPAATMADIAQAAGVSQGLAYRYFASKEQLYRELLEQAVAQASLMTSPRPPESVLTSGQRLAWLITRLVEYRRDHLEIFQLLDQVLRAEQAADDVTNQIRQRGERFVAEVRDLIVAGQASGEVAAGDPDQLVTALVATLDGLVRFGLHDPTQFPQRCPDARIILRLLGL
jgi:AcrR family transcriptional regulator